MGGSTPCLPTTRRKQEQVVERVPPGGEGADTDHTADEFGWNSSS